ncbi:MAG: lamin tail domain-containing protein, partial [Verrucomicrobiota bacterium]
MINEFMAINNNTLQDEDGDFEDWIELWNQAGTNVNMAGWYLTDDPGDLTKWEFPAVVMTGNTYLVVFASNKDRDTVGSELHTDFRLGGGGEYLALVQPDGSTVAFSYAPEFPAQQADISYGIRSGANTESMVLEPAGARATVPTGPIAGWNNLVFDDSSWSNGFTGVGYDTAVTYDPFLSLDLQTIMQGSNETCYIRIPFVVTNVGQIASMELLMRYDDGFAAYINGNLAASDNTPGVLTWNSGAPANRPDGIAVTLASFAVPGGPGFLVEGTNMLAIHGLNNGIGSSDLLLSPVLRGIRVATNAGLQVRYFSTPTPGAVNANDFLGFVADTKFTFDRGFYTNAFTTDVTSATLGATIVYTLDGSTPTLVNGTQVPAVNATSPPTASIIVSNTTTLRAMAFLSGFEPSDVDTVTYIFVADVLQQSPTGAAPGPGWPAIPVNGQVVDYGMDPDILSDPRYTNRVDDALLALPSISIVSDLVNFWDPATG